MLTPPQSTRWEKAMLIALIEDDQDLNLLFTNFLQIEGYQVATFACGEDFLSSLQRDNERYALVLCDYILPAQNGFQTYLSARKIGLHCPFLLMTAFGNFDVAVQALKSGVADYVLKPVSREELLRKVSAYIEKQTLEEEVLFNRLGRTIIARSPQMQEILRKLSRIARSKASILLTGESGTGKEVLSNMLHECSQRSEQGRFVGVNVSAIPETLFEAEFFGYQKGAFTDAIRDHDGYARLADGGTLFMDEIGDLSLTSQAKLLRLLEERKVQPLGAKKAYPVDFRLIAATHRDLQRLVKEGAFREDLYYRLAVISVEIPPLRERPSDIVPLARHLLEDLAREESIDVIDFTPQAQEKLLSYGWPGNVRELKNRVHEALLATEQSWIDAHHISLPEDPLANDMPLSYERAKSSFERRYITYLLRITRGNINRTSEIAGISRKAIYDMMKRHDLHPDQFRS